MRLKGLEVLGMDRDGNITMGISEKRKHQCSVAVRSYGRRSQVHDRPRSDQEMG